MRRAAAAPLPTCRCELLECALSTGCCPDIMMEHLLERPEVRPNPAPGRQWAETRHGFSPARPDSG